MPHPPAPVPAGSAASFAKAAARDAAAAPAGARTPLVSVVVPVRNDTERLRLALERLAEQTLPREQFEIVVGDDGSSHGALAGIATDDRWIHVVACAQRTSYAARNAAVAAARGDVLAFCDSDCLPDPNWLEAGLTALATADIVAGEVVFAAPESATAWSLLTIDMFLDQKRNVGFGRAVTANLFVRRAMFEALGGFDPTLPSGGDYDFVRRALQKFGARLRYEPAAVVRHPTIDTRSAFLRKVWLTNHWSAVRRARDGFRPDAIAGLLALAPPVGVVCARRNARRRPFRLERARLDAAGVRIDVRRELRALLCLYFVVAYVAGTARVWGWFRAGRILRTHSDGAPTLPAATDAA